MTTQVAGGSSVPFPSDLAETPQLDACWRSRLDHWDCQPMRVNEQQNFGALLMRTAFVTMMARRTQAGSGNTPLEIITKEGRFRTANAAKQHPSVGQPSCGVGISTHLTHPPWSALSCSRLALSATRPLPRPGRLPARDDGLTLVHTNVQNVNVSCEPTAAILAPRTWGIFNNKAEPSNPANPVPGLAAESPRPGWQEAGA